MTDKATQLSDLGLIKTGVGDGWLSQSVMTTRALAVLIDGVIALWLTYHA